MATYDTRELDRLNLVLIPVQKEQAKRFLLTVCFFNLGKGIQTFVRNKKLLRVGTSFISSLRKLFLCLGAINWMLDTVLPNKHSVLISEKLMQFNCP